MRSVTIALVVSVLSALIPTLALARSPSFSSADLPRIVPFPPPSAPGLAKKFDFGDATFCNSDYWIDLADLRRNDPSDCDRRMVAKLAQLGFQRGLVKGWTAYATPVVEASAVGLVFRTGAGAHGFFAFMKTESLKPVVALGDEGMRAVFKDEAVYLWRIGNLVLTADIDCPDGPCRFDVGAATRTYVNAISRRAARV